MLTLPSKKIFSLIFPYHCLLCHQKSSHLQDLCVGCRNDLPFYGTGCLRCAAPIKITNTTCGACLKRPPPFNFTFCLFRYEAPVTKLLMELKFHGNLVNARVLGELMAEALQRHYSNKPLPDVIIPVPLHVKRLRERGFNQALELGRPISKLLKIPQNTSLCQRIIYTDAQARLSAKVRRRSLKNAYKVHELIENKHVAILDDVVTTGRTISELSQACANKGAKQVDVWCCAKSLLTFSR